MRTLSILFVVFSLTVTVMVSADPFPFAPFPPAPEGAFAVTVDDETVDLLAAQGTSDPFLGTSDPFVDAMDSLLAADLVAPMAASVPCEPGLIYWESRNALGRLLKWTASDLRGTKYRAPWFQAFPWTKSFPEAGEVAGAKYRYNSMGTVGIVKSTSPWPLQYNPGAPPVDEAACVAIAHGFMQLWGDLIMLNGRMQELVVDRVTINRNGEWSVVAGQEYQGIRVIGARVMINGDEFGDVFTMQSNYVPNLAVDVVPTYGVDALDRILMGSGNPQLANGGYEYAGQPELTVAHTASDPCSGTLLWKFAITVAVGDMFSYLVDAHRGEVYGYGRIDAQDVDEYELYNFKGNHGFRFDELPPNACGPGGAFACHWVSDLETNKANVALQSLWDTNLILLPPTLPPPNIYWSSRKCEDDPPTGLDCLNASGFPFEDPPDSYGEIASLTGNHYMAYDSTTATHPDPVAFDCWIEDDDANNPWRIFDPSPLANNEYNAGKWIVDDVEDLVAYIEHMNTELTAIGVVPTPDINDIGDDFPSFSVLASEPREPDSGVPFDDELQSPFFSTSSSTWSPNGRWGNQRILIAPNRYNRSFDGGDQLASDDNIYHEFGHMLWHGFPHSNYYEGNDPNSTAPTSFHNDACIMWQGIYRESMPDTVAALVEYYRWSNERVVVENGNANAFIDSDLEEYKPDWSYGEGLTTGSARSMQRPDRYGLSRRPESLNDFRFRRWDDPGDDYNDAEIHGASGLISRFNFLFGNDICDRDNGCAGNADELVNDPCSCGAGAPHCDDSLGTYLRANDRYHTIYPPSSCILDDDTATPVDPGYQQYHFGVKVPSLSQTHVGGENGLERLGRLYFRMLFDNSAITYQGDEFLPYAFMDAMEDAFMKDTGWAFPEYFDDLHPFYRARDAVGFWTDIGNYFPIPQTIADEGLSAALVNWKPSSTNPEFNTEWIFGFSPLNHTIYLALRLCWNDDDDLDGDMDYCLASSSWYYYIVDGPAIHPAFGTRSVPSVDVNDEDNGDPPDDPNHGLWIVYNATVHAAWGDIDGICKRQVPISPNTGLPTPRECTANHVSNLRPGVGHYIAWNPIPTEPIETREVIVYADADDGGHLKSFEWGVPGSELEIQPSNACQNFSSWRPEVVNHDGYVWALWTSNPAGSDLSMLCYSRLRHDDPDPWNPFQMKPPYWEDPRRIPFEGDFDTCGTQDRRLNGPPEAETRNGIINLVIRDVETANAPYANEPWVWMIQLSDDVALPHGRDGMFEECMGLEEAAGDCRDEIPALDNNFEERSNWVPHTEFYANPNSSEVGALASTEHMLNMTNTLSGNRQDYTFFYNPAVYTPPDPEKATGNPLSDVSVWVRESW